MTIEAAQRIGALEAQVEVLKAVVKLLQDGQMTWADRAKAAEARVATLREALGSIATPTPNHAQPHCALSKWMASAASDALAATADGKAVS